MSSLPFVQVPQLQAPTINKYDGIVTGKGTASSQFQRWWQSVIRALSGTTDAIVQNQQILQAQTDYLTAAALWQQELGSFTVARVTYLQLAVAAIATDTGTVLPDPSGLPDYPGPPPDPPYA